VSSPSAADERERGSGNLTLYLGSEEDGQNGATTELSEGRCPAAKCRGAEQTRRMRVRGLGGVVDGEEQHGDGVARGRPEEAGDGAPERGTGGDVRRRNSRRWSGLGGIDRGGMVEQMARMDGVRMWRSGDGQKWPGRDRPKLTNGGGDGRQWREAKVA